MSLTEKMVMLAVSVALGVSTSLPAHAEKGIAENQIVIATSNALSGNNEFAGKQTTIGINTYFNALNAEGGINGRKFKVISCDDKYEPESAISCFQKLSSESAFAITGLVGSALLAKYIPMCMNNKIPAVGFYSGPTFVSTPAKSVHFYCASRLSDRRTSVRR